MSYLAYTCSHITHYTSNKYGLCTLYNLVCLLDAQYSDVRGDKSPTFLVVAGSTGIIFTGEAWRRSRGHTRVGITGGWPFLLANHHSNVQLSVVFGLHPPSHFPFSIQNHYLSAALYTSWVLLDFASKMTQCTHVCLQISCISASSIEECILSQFHKHITHTSVNILLKLIAVIDSLSDANNGQVFISTIYAI